jgi:hypothetical protein
MRDEGLRHNRFLQYLVGLCWLGLGLFPGWAMAQPGNRPEGHFLADTQEVGRPVRYVLSWQHSSLQDGIFPDTARDFAPFLVRNMAVFATNTQNGISRDSAVYTLVSFETSPTQTLRVPVQLVGPTDCTQLWSGTDTIWLRSQLQTARPDTLALATETTVKPLRQQLNYPVLAVVLLAITLVFTVLYALFGRLVMQRLQRYRFAQRHKTFRRNYDRLTGGIRAETAAETAKQALIIWCDYLQYLVNEPFNALTTREIVAQLQKTGVVAVDDEELAEALRETDRIIYGGAFSNQSTVSLRFLRGIAVALYLGGSGK